MSTQDILNEREKTHGDFYRVSETWVQLKNIVDSNIASDNYSHIAAIDMILLKLARIACGDPNFADHWDDIAGYAMLGKGGCSKNEPDYSIRHIFSCQYKFAGCDCVSFCKVKAGYKT